MQSKPGDVLTLAALLADLRELKADMDRRYDVLGRLPVDRCPEGKVTPALARDRSLGLHPIVIGIDEFQRYSGHPVHGAEIVDLLTELAKAGPAAGIMGVLATQKPDPDSIPKLRDVIGTRFCLKVMNYQSSDAALGAGAYSAGYDASRFQRAHATRINAGTLTGHAAGDEPAQPIRVNVAADVRAVFRDGEDKRTRGQAVGRKHPRTPPLPPGGPLRRLGTRPAHHRPQTPQSPTTATGTAEPRPGRHAGRREPSGG